MEYILNILEEFINKEAYIRITSPGNSNIDHEKTMKAFYKLTQFVYNRFKDDNGDFPPKVVLKDQEIGRVIDDIEIINSEYITRHGENTILYLYDVDLYEQQIILALDDEEKDYGAQLETDISTFLAAYNLDVIVDDLISLEIEELNDCDDEDISSENSDVSEDNLEDIELQLAKVIKKLVRKEIKEILTDILDKI